eukprot:CAMPEP_0172685626 /NCGR_PEP_ID=MMETSP1074-20121228/20378_1 /TAXON_ID=2916 /ORGANISM="Ceratium fusus, Strain PA161109" /LENGTH=104 /DNA_ID=CAMNT_0013504809 /DNA_START=93 /DNA_END=407 /DNA_ORIENTATION=+
MAHHSSHGDHCMVVDGHPVNDTSVGADPHIFTDDNSFRRGGLLKDEAVRHRAMVPSEELRTCGNASEVANSDAPWPTIKGSTMVHRDVLPKLHTAMDETVRSHE